MEKSRDEKTWNDFWMTGKVTDYLSYRNSVKEGQENGTTTRGDGDGAGHHADLGL